MRSLDCRSRAPSDPRLGSSWFVSCGAELNYDRRPPGTWATLAWLKGSLRREMGIMCIRISYDTC